MKKASFIVSIIILTLAGGFALWVSWEDLFLSKNYRAYNSYVHHKRLLGKSFLQCIVVKRCPSSEYPFSGGGRINVSQVARMNKSHDGSLFVVNLRENDGYYFANHPITYYGMYIRDGKFRYRQSVKKQKKWLYNYRKWLANIPINIENLTAADLGTESQILHRLGIHYVQFNLIRQDFASQWNFVDDAIALFESFPPKAWVHFHCAGGRGRTTTLIIMYDIFRNSHSTSLDEILTHHYCLGGENVQNTRVKLHGSWSKHNLEGRLRLLETFYEYMRSPRGYPHSTWLKWLDERGIPVEFTLA